MQYTLVSAYDRIHVDVFSSLQSNCYALKHDSHNFTMECFQSWGSDRLIHLFRVLFKEFTTYLDYIFTTFGSLVSDLFKATFV